PRPHPRPGDVESDQLLGLARSKRSQRSKQIHRLKQVCLALPVVAPKDVEACMWLDEDALEIAKMIRLERQHIHFMSPQSSSASRLAFRPGHGRAFPRPALRA